MKNDVLIFAVIINIAVVGTEAKAQHRSRIGAVGGTRSTLSKNIRQADVENYI